MPTDKPEPPVPADDNLDLVSEETSGVPGSNSSKWFSKFTPQKKPRPALKNQEVEHLFNENERGEATRRHLHKAFLCVIWLVFIFAVVTFSVRLIHLILPVNIHWLDPEQVQGIDKFLFSGAMGGFLGRYLNKIL